MEKLYCYNKPIPMTNHYFYGKPAIGQYKQITTSMVNHYCYGKPAIGHDHQYKQTTTSTASHYCYGKLYSETVAKVNKLEKYTSITNESISIWSSTTERIYSN